MDAYVFKELKKEKCIGCEVCVSVCPHNAMVMEMDDTGFFYPKTNELLCIKCGICIKKCPQMSIVKKDRINAPKVYAGYSLDPETVYTSSSGGMFTEICKQFLQEYSNGLICGASWDDDYKGVHYEIGNLDILTRIKKSKYIQSRKNNIYKLIERYLMEGVHILFSGCPCEVAALASYLGKSYENLFLVDFVCQGPTAPKVMEEYVERLQKKYNSKIVDINLRLPASNNWIPQWSRIKFDNKKIYTRAFYETDLGVAVHYMQRPSCFSCEYKGQNRFSDITLGDFHGVDKYASYYNSLGTSILCVNTVKGEFLYKKLLGSVNTEMVEYGKVNDSNRRMTIPREKTIEDIKFEMNYKRYGLCKAVKNTLPLRKKIKYYMPTVLSNLINGYKRDLFNER